MINGMMAHPANPLDQILGSGGQAGQAKRSGRGDFDGMLGIFPQMAQDKPMMGAIQGDGLTAAVAEAGLAGRTALLLPTELANLLGLAGEKIPPELKQAFPNGLPDGLQLARGEVMKGLGDDGTLYLRIPSQGQGEGEDMVLPLRLRTAEMQEGRIIIDAALQNAAGKDGELRLRLELAGNLNDIRNAATSDGTRMAVEKNNELPQLLSQLNARVMVIEVVDEGGRANNPAFSDQLAAFRRNHNLKIKNAEQEQVSLGRTLMDKASESEKIGLDLRQSRLDQQMISDQKQTLAELAEKRLGGNEGVRVEGGNIGSISSNTEGSRMFMNQMTRLEEPEMMRFHNLDDKISQLKQQPGQKIQVQLMPPRLGKMNLSIAANRAQVMVHVTVESAAAGRAVEQNLSVLENKLAASGIKVDSFQIHVTNQERNNTLNPHHAQTWQQNGQGHHQHHHHQGQKQGPQYGQWQRFEDENVSFERVMVNFLA